MGIAILAAILWYFAYSRLASQRYVSEIALASAEEINRLNERIARLERNLRAKASLASFLTERAKVRKVREGRFSVQN